MPLTQREAQQGTHQRSTLQSSKLRPPRASSGAVASKQPQGPSMWTSEPCLAGTKCWEHLNQGQGRGCRRRRGGMMSAALLVAVSVASLLQLPGSHADTIIINIGNNDTQPSPPPTNETTPDSPSPHLPVLPVPADEEVSSPAAGVTPTTGSSDPVFPYIMTSTIEVASADKFFQLSDCYLMWSVVEPMRLKDAYRNYTCSVCSNVGDSISSHLQFTAVYVGSQLDPYMWQPLLENEQLFMGATIYDSIFDKLGAGCHAEASYSDTYSSTGPLIACPSGQTYSQLFSYSSLQEQCVVSVPMSFCNGGGVVGLSVSPPAVSPTVPATCTVVFVASKGGDNFPMQTNNGTQVVIMDYCTTFAQLTSAYFMYAGQPAPSPLCRDQGWTDGMVVYAAYVPTKTIYDTLVVGFKTSAQTALNVANGLALGCKGAISVYSPECGPTPVIVDYNKWPSSFQCPIPSPSPSPSPAPFSPWWISPTPPPASLSLSLGFKNSVAAFKYIQRMPCNTLVYLIVRALNLDGLLTAIPECSLSKQSARITVSFTVANASVVDRAGDTLLAENGLYILVWKARIPCETAVYFYSGSTGLYVTLSCGDGTEELCCPEPWRKPLKPKPTCSCSCPQATPTCPCSCNNNGGNPSPTPSPTPSPWYTSPAVYASPSSPYVYPSPSPFDPFLSPYVSPNVSPYDPFASPAISPYNPFVSPSPSPWDPFASPGVSPFDPFASPGPTQVDPFASPVSPLPFYGKRVDNGAPDAGPSDAGSIAAPNIYVELPHR